jgi:hypothetical protein
VVVASVHFVVGVSTSISGSHCQRDNQEEEGIRVTFVTAVANSKSDID